MSRVPMHVPLTLGHTNSEFRLLLVIRQTMNDPLIDISRADT